MTANNGIYQFAELTTGLNYTVTPSLPGFVFNPSSRSYTNLNSDQRADFSAVACAFSISPVARSFPATGGTGSVTIMSPDAQCQWTARSNAPWIRITSTTGGVGNGMITFSVDPTVGSRSGTISVAGNTFGIFQEFNPCAAASFQSTPSIQLPTKQLQLEFSVRDFNKDGLPDLAIPTNNSPPTAMFFPAQADGDFGEPTTVLNLQARVALSRRSKQPT